MKNARPFNFAVPTFVLLITGASVMAGQFDLSWNTIDGGGGRSTAGPFVLDGTIGQPDLGSMSGGTFALNGGYWPGVLLSCPADIAPPGGDGLINVSDLLLVIIDWGACPPPCTVGFGCPADVTDNCVVDVDDMLAVIGGWGVCP